MRGREFFGRPWALLPEALAELAHSAALELSGREVEALAPGENLRDEQAPYQLFGRTAVIPVYGVLEKRADAWAWLFGGASTEGVRLALDTALADSRVSSVVLDIDSPGGSVDGTQELADHVRANRQASGGAKPIIAYANGTMASAAYWIGSAADRVVAGKTAQVGSIGVRMVHFDQSKMLDNMGVAATEIYSGKYKTAGSPYKPLDDESREYLQGRSDRYFTLFVGEVAANRGVAVAQILPLADGRVWIGAEALAAGIVDEIGTLESAINMAATKGAPMNKETLKANHPEVYQEILNEGATTVTMPDLEKVEAEAYEEGYQTGTEAERTRAVQILEARGPVDLTLAALGAGTDPGTFALSVLKAEREAKGAALDRLEETLAPAVPVAPKAKPGEVVDFMVAARARAQDKGVTLGEALRQVRAEQPELAEEFSRAARLTLKPA